MGSAAKSSSATGILIISPLDPMYFFVVKYAVFPYDIPYRIFPTAANIRPNLKLYKNLSHYRNYFDRALCY